MQRFGVLLQQLVGHLGHSVLGADGFLRMCDAESEDHLALPERDGVDDGGLDLLRHHGVVVLDEADLRRHLETDVAGQLKVVDLLFEAGAEVREIPCLLGVFGQAGFIGFAEQLGESGLALGLELLLAGEDVHRDLLEVIEVALVHLVEHRNILHKNDLVLFEVAGDAVNIDFGLVIAQLQRFDLAALLLQETAQAFLFGVVIEALELRDQRSDHLAGLAEVLRANRTEGAVRELGKLLLACGTVLHDLGRVRDVDLLGEAVDRGELLGGEAGTCDDDLLHRFVGLFGSGYLLLLFGLGDGIESQLGDR